jgi:hypothetical protein
MLFTEPVEFREALESREVKVLLPTTLSSRELEQMSPETRERAAFSARVANAGFIAEFDTLTREILNPRRVQREDGSRATEGMDFATARLKLKEYLDRTGYQAAEGEEGTIKDLRSDKRLNLILETNTQMAQGYGGWKQGQNAPVLDVWPASELYRAEERDEKRDWVTRWLNAAGEVEDEKAGAALRRFGRMVARKDSAIWRNLGPFKLPYEPFDFNSGMGTRDVERDDAVSLGVMESGTTVQPQDRGFNDDLQASLEVRSEALRQAVLEDLGDEYIFEGDVLKKRNEGTTTPPAGSRSAIRPTRRPRLPQNPVSNALQIARRKPASLEETKQVIDQVHDDGQLKRIYVTGEASGRRFGGYQHTREDAIGIGVRLRHGDEFTFLHEIGHFLDHQALGVKGSFASAGSPLLQEWRAAVQSSAAYRRLKQALSDPDQQQYRREIQYLKSDVEVWARSYAQWMKLQIEKRGLGSAAMRARLKEELTMRLDAPYQSGHWTDEDFEPIAAAIDRLFERKGWLL